MYMKLRAVPEIWDEDKALPPILVSGETISESELGLSVNNSSIRKTGKLSTVVRWFPGVHMYRVLHSISKRGIESVRMLLLAAGNDEDSLDLVVPVSKLLAKSTL